MATSTPAPGYYGNSSSGFGGSGITQIQQMVSDWVRERGRPEGRDIHLPIGWRSSEGARV